MNITETKIAINLVLFGLPENPSRRSVLNKITEKLTSDDLYDQVMNSLSCSTEDSILDIETWVTEKVES